MWRDQFSKVVATARQLAAWARRYRTALVIAGSLLFVIGAIWSIMRLEITVAQIRFEYLLLLAVILVPASIVYAAASFVVMAKATKAEVPFSSSLRIASVAQLSEFLPIPGGAIVRTGALMQLGTRTGEAAAHVMIGAILWVACAAIAAGISLGWLSVAGSMIFFGGAIVTVVCMAWLTHRAGIGIALSSLVLRLIGLVISGFRISASFLAIGFTLGILEVYPFAFASIAGSASSIAPGGMGVGEALAASIATLTRIDPAAAFLAVGLNRVIGLLVSGILTMLLFVSKPKEVPEVG